MRVALFAVLVSILTVPVHAATYFVATTGNDASAGTISSPFRTITKAATVVRAGDVVEVRGGVYPDLVKIGSKGTATARITFRSYAGETAIVDGASTAAGTNLVTLAGATYVDFTGFEVRNAKRIGICGYPANNVRIANNVIHDSVHNGIYTGSTSSDVIVEGNTVRNNVLENQYHTSTGGWGQAIGMSNTPRATVRNNRVYNNDGEGIVILLSDGGLVQNNEVFDNFSVGIYLDNAQQTKVNANFIYSTGNTRYYRSGHPATGIGTANESYSTSNPLDGLQITNNIVVNAKYGFYYSNEELGGGLKNSTISNNTFYKATQTMLWIAAATHTGTVIENNIFSQVGATMTNVAGTGAVYRSNDWYGGTAGAAAGLGDVIGDPHFVNAGGLTADDYRIAGGSMAIEKAADVASLLTTDYWGHTRSPGFDIGAHEYSLITSSIDSSNDSTAPTAPEQLRVTNATSSSIALSWNAATDNVGVTAYAIRRNGVEVATLSTTSWTDRNVSAGTTYTYDVIARDAKGNESVAASVTASTTGNAPRNARTTAVTSSLIALRWDAADNATAYKVYRNGSFTKQVAVPGYTDQNLRAGTSYTYQISALAANGTESSRITITATTSATAGKSRSARH